MSITAAKKGDWNGTIDSGSETADKPAGRQPAPLGYKWRREIFKVDRMRNVQGVTNFTSEAGTEQLGTAITFKNGGDSLAGSAAHTYITSIDNLKPSPPGSGIWDQIQSHTSYEDWELWKLP